MIYFQTATSYGWVTDAGQIPAGGAEITQAAYLVLVAADEAAQAAAALVELQAAYDRYTTAYDSYRALGLPIVNAMLLASMAGIEPPDFEPTLMDVELPV